MATPNWKTAAIAVAFAGAGIVALAVLSGVVYEQTQRARDRERFPQVGRSFDIGGRTLNIDCMGGRPARSDPGERLPIGRFTTPRRCSPMAGRVRATVGSRSSALLRPLPPSCWYDRAGSGWSDPGPYPRDSASQARDPHALLRAARISPPYVLVGESSAALDARVYTGSYPSEVAGTTGVRWSTRPIPRLSLDPRSGRGKRAGADSPVDLSLLQDACGAVV